MTTTNSNSNNTQQPNQDQKSQRNRNQSRNGRRSNKKRKNNNNIIGRKRKRNFNDNHSLNLSPSPIKPIKQPLSKRHKPSPDRAKTPGLIDEQSDDDDDEDDDLLLNPSAKITKKRHLNGMHYAHSITDVYSVQFFPHSYVYTLHNVLNLLTFTVKHSHFF